MSTYRSVRSTTFNALRGVASKLIFTTPKSPPPQPHRARRGAVLSSMVLGTGAAILYFKNLETVPYTNRTRFILRSKSFEREFGQSQMELLKLEDEKLNLEDEKYILPSNQPESVRVRRIADKIIGALLQKELRRERFWSAPKHDLGIEDVKYIGEESGSRRAPPLMAVLFDRWNAWMNCRGAWGVESMTEHLMELNWEVVVNKRPIMTVDSGPNMTFAGGNMGGGKILIASFVNRLSDAEIAFIISHEVGHALGRHLMEDETNEWWFSLYEFLVLKITGDPELAKERTDVLLRRPSCRRIEAEAEYIGMLLMASAGYDPHVAIRMNERQWVNKGKPELEDPLSTHPSKKRMAQILSQDHVMEEALSMYREALLSQKKESPGVDFSSGPALLKPITRVMRVPQPYP